MLKKFLYIVIALLFITCLRVGSINRLSNEKNDSIINVSKGLVNMTWNDLEVNQSSGEISMIVIKTANYLGELMFFMSRTGYRYGYENPEYNYEFMFNLVMAIAWSLLIFYLSPIIITVGLLIYYLIKYIQTKKSTSSKYEHEP